MSGNVRILKIKDGRGGARPGAGRKPLTISEKAVKDLIKAAKKKAKETRKTIYEILIEIAYGKGKVSKRDQLAAIKLYLDATVNKNPQVSTEKLPCAPVVGLPPTREDPAKVIQGKKGKGRGGKLPSPLNPSGPTMGPAK